MADVLISIRNVKKYFNTKNGLLHAVDDINLDIEKGTTVGLVGESGCGKSRLGGEAVRLIGEAEGQM